MSTSLLYHAFGAKTYDYTKTEYRQGMVWFHLWKKTAHQRCTACRSRNVIYGGTRKYLLRTLPIGPRPVRLVLHLKILICRDCQARRQESRDIAEPRKSYTKRLARYVVSLSQHMTLKAIAKLLGLGWDLVKQIIADDLGRRAKKRSWRRVRRIAIDEIAVRKGHQYMTIVVDLDSGEVLYTAKGRDHSCLKPFFRRLRRARAKLEGGAVDMSAAYLKALREYAPSGVTVVHDRYHVVAAMNEVVDQVRRDEQRRLEGEDKQVLKGSRYLLLKGQEKLQEFPEQRSRLEELLEANELLHLVYLLKEDLRQFWSQPSKVDAVRFIDRCIEEAIALEDKHVTRLANTIAARFHQIVGWYNHRITTGPLEGLNNKIKVLKRQAYGYRNQEFFGLRILFLHETKFNLSGV